MNVQIKIYVHPDLCRHYRERMAEDSANLRMDLEEAPRPGDCIDLSHMGRFLVSTNHGYLFRPVLDVAGGDTQEMVIQADQAKRTPDEPWVMEVTARGPEWKYLGQKEEILDIWTVAGVTPERSVRV